MPRSIDVIVEVNGHLSRRTLERGSTAADLLQLLDLLPDANIVVKDKIPIPITQALKDGDRIHIIKVASGG
jgi:sulfur carrier protein ThiS